MIVKMVGGAFILTALAVSGCTHGDRTGDDVKEVATAAPPAAPKTTKKVIVSENGDNSKVNQVQGTAAATTADDQSDSATDVELTRKIRRSLTQDSGLSVYAHNVKIITANGHVVLKGPVRSEAEKATVEKRARQYAGADAVTSDLVVTPR